MILIQGKGNDYGGQLKKKPRKYLDYMNQMIYLCIAFQGKHIKFGLWCNGSTTGFGSVCPGSNPGSPTTNQRKALRDNLLGLSSFL